jgi:DNA-binding Lrp family transcriptional regulator
MMGDLDFLSSRDVARLLRVNRQTVLWRVKRLSEKGHVLGVKLGRDWVFRPWEVALLRDLAARVGRPKARQEAK